MQKPVPITRYDDCNYDDDEDTDPIVRKKMKKNSLKCSQDRHVHSCTRTSAKGHIPARSPNAHAGQIKDLLLSHARTHVHARAHAYCSSLTTSLSAFLPPSFLPSLSLTLPHSPSLPSRTPSLSPSLQLSFIPTLFPCETHHGHTRQDPSVTYVDRIVPGFAAERSGRFTVGDTVLSIDGASVQDYTLDAIKGLTIGPSGTAVTIEFLRGGEIQSVTLIRRVPGFTDGSNADATNILIPARLRDHRSGSPSPSLYGSSGVGGGGAVYGSPSRYGSPGFAPGGHDSIYGSSGSAKLRFGGGTARDYMGSGAGAQGAGIYGSGSARDEKYVPRPLQGSEMTY